MTALPPETALVLAVHRYITDPTSRAHAQALVDASTKDVNGALHQQLRDAAKRAIMVKDSERHLVLGGLTELLRAIGNEALARRTAAFSDEPPAASPAEKPARAVALSVPRPVALRSVRLPYADE